jgi:MFS family permease
LTRLDSQAAVIASSTVLTALAVSAIAFAALIPIERHAVSPMIAPALFATRQLIVTYALEVAIGILEGALFFVPAALIAAQHMTYAFAGAIAAIGAVVFVAVIPGAGRAIDKFGSRAVLTVGAVLTAIGLAIVGAGLTSLPLAILGLTVAGFGFGSLLGAPTRYIITNEVPSTVRASAVGLLSIFLIIGQIVGGSLAGGVVGLHLEDAAGYQHAYFTFAAIAILTAAGTFALKPRSEEQSSK